MAAYALYARAGEGDEPARALVGGRLRALAFALAGVVLALLAAGTIVTGTGPHAGDADARRFGFDLEQVARLHGGIAWATVALTVTLLIGLHRAGAPRPVRRHALDLFLLELAQGAIGYTQYALDLPALLVGPHILGSALVWLATLRVVFATRSRGPLRTAAERRPPAREAPQPV